jgi:hypothetical protein
VRLGRVQAIETRCMVLAQGQVALAADETLFIDCTASALAKRPLKAVFDGTRITLQMIRIPQPTFSAACIAFIEASFGDASDDQKTRHCAPIPLPDALEDFPLAQITDQINRYHAARLHDATKAAVANLPRLAAA